jgi:hypothetical protein
MRGSLLHPIRERPARRARGKRRVPHAHEPAVATPRAETAVPANDSAAQRVREAGGPTDLASYSCQCGYLFKAAVSTTVGCPHCGTAQAW